jgi:hypothetical protein
MIFVDNIPFVSLPGRLVSEQSAIRGLVVTTATCHRSESFT